MLCSKIRPGIFPSPKTVITWINAFLISRISYCFPVAIFTEYEQKQLDYCLMMPMRKVLAQPYDASIDYLFLESQILDTATLFSRAVYTFSHRLLSSPPSHASASLDTFNWIHNLDQHPRIPNSHSSVHNAWPFHFHSAIQQTGFLFDCTRPIPRHQFKRSVRAQCLQRRLDSILRPARNLHAPFIDNFVTFHDLHRSFPSLIPSFLLRDPPPIATIKTALRLGTSRLRDTLYRKHKSDSPCCHSCLHHLAQPRVLLDDLDHRLWVCPSYAGPRAVFLSSVRFPASMNAAEQRALVHDCAIDSPLVNWSSIISDFRVHLNRFLLAIHCIDDLIWKWR